MPTPLRVFPRLCLAAAAAAAAGLALGVSGPARAEKADRLQPIVIEADKPGTLDLQRQVVVFNGNVQIVQGSLQIRAERIEVRELPGGQRAAVATGDAKQPAQYRQKREGLNEVVEGSADRIDYNGQTGALLFVGNGSVRRLRDGVVVDQITGAVISWDDGAQLFSVKGSDGQAANPGGRVRAVLTPRPATNPASSPAAPR